MTKPLPLKKGDWVICTHYKGHKRYKIVDINTNREVTEYWVAACPSYSWWGPRSWFRKLPK